MLFADKREVELVSNGKTREVCTANLSIHTLEHMGEPRREKREDEELGLDPCGRQWRDRKGLSAAFEEDIPPQEGGTRLRIEVVA